MKHRQQRVENILKRRIAQVVQHELSDPRICGMVSITRVKVSPDLSIAHVYVSVFGASRSSGADEEENDRGELVVRALQHAAGRIQSRIKPDLKLRLMPALKFHLDESLKRAAETLELIRQVM